MKSLSLIACLILTVVYLSSAQAVTDAELEALEKQIEQQEADEIEQVEAKEKMKAEAEAKRKAEQKRKAEDEAEKKRLVELENQRQEEQKRLAKLESKRQEEEAKKRAEEEKEKYNLLLTEAKQAVSNKDKELAINIYNEALILFPGDTVANLGIKEAEKLMDKICYAFLGKWVWADGFKDKMEILENGTIITSSPLGDKTFHWTCIPENRQLKHDRIETKKYKNLLFLTLSEDGTCISDPLLWPSDGCWQKQD